jgi:hypothetical protein
MLSSPQVRPDVAVMTSALEPFAPCKINWLSLRHALGRRKGAHSFPVSAALKLHRWHIRPAFGDRERRKGPHAMMRAMPRRLLPVLVSMTLLAPLPATAGPGAAKQKPGGAEQDQAEPDPVAGNSGGHAGDGRIAVTRSDGSTGYMRPPDPKDIRKLVGYMRDGINRATQSEKQRSARRVQNRRR